MREDTDMGLKKILFLGMGLMIAGCAAETTEPEQTASNQEELIAPGMLQTGYSPVESGALPETVALFNFGQIGENLVFVEEGGETVVYVSTTNFSFTGPPVPELTRVVVSSGQTTGIPVLDGNGVPAFGGFMSGIDVDESDGSVVFALSFLDQSGLFALGTSIYKYVPAAGQMFEIGGGAGIGVNGLLVHNGYWYGADTLNPNGVILRGSTMGGPAEVWLQDAALAPAAGYMPQPYSCDPPPMGVNGLRPGGRLLPCLQSFAVTNVTTKQVLEVPLNADGSAGTPSVMYSLANYPDGLDQGTCGLTRKDTFIAAPADDKVLWANPYTQEVVEVLSDCDGATSMRTNGGYLYAVCAASPLSCGTSQPRLVRIKLDTGYEAMCNWN